MSVRFIVLFAASVALAAGQQTQPPSFRARITIVPIDIRVLDRDGKPITDLKQNDFTITENGVAQDIRFFSTHALTAEPEAAAGSVELRKAATPGDLAPQNRRVFLVVLGRGHMTGPAKELPALEEFLTTKLLPQDRVAVLAYNRGTDFTTDHHAVRAVVERYRDRHERIETALDEYFAGLHGLYGSKQIPASLQSDIDNVFGGSGRLRPREITPGQISDERRIAADVRRTADDLQRADILAGRTGDFLTLPDWGATNTADLLDTSFDQYIAAQVELMHDLSNLYAGIDYLRYLEGEKHLVFVTPVGIALPRFENDRTLAAVASDARVALDVIYTAGAPVGPQPIVTRDHKISAPVLPTTASIFQQTATVNDMRAMSEITGGQLTAFRSAEYGLTHLDQVTRFEYLLGYSPSNTTMDGAFRQIEVKVKRPGARVLYRQGYFANAERVPLDRRQFITFNRLSAAGRYQGQIEDIKVTLDPPALGGQVNSHEIVVTGTIRSSRIKFSQSDGLYRASLEIAVYAGTDKGDTVGEVQRRVNLQLKEATYREFAGRGASFDVRVPLKARPKYVKVIVYDYAADMLGSAISEVR